MKRSLIAVALVLVALPMAAQMTHPGRMPGLGMPSGSMMSMDVAVGGDGTAYVVRKASGGTGYELAAIRPSGTVAWTFALQNQGAMSIAVNSTTVFVTSFGTTGTFPNLTLKSQLLGLSTASGTPFTVELDGIAMDVTTFNDGAYVMEVAGGTGGMPMTGTSFGRKLLSVSNSGKVNWTLPLD